MDSLKEKMASSSSFLWLYVLVMIPTYILPYMGSNSLLVGAVSGGATLPLFLVHLACLVALCVFAKLRGDIIGKSWIVTLPIAAAVFDMVPGLSLIPLIPSVFHGITLAIGAQEPDPRGPDVFS